MKHWYDQLTKQHFFYRFLAWSIVLQFLVWKIETTPYWAELIEHALANMVGFLYGLFSSQWFIIENKIYHSNSLRFLVVDSACTGLSLIATLWSAFFALPLRWYKKLALALYSAILLQVENSFRITHLFYEIKQVDNNFDFFHLYVWQIINFIFAIVIFRSLVVRFMPNNNALTQ